MLPPGQSGIALILVLIFSVLLYVLVAELVVTARTQRLTGESEALVARMHNHMVYTLAQVEEQLRDDLAAGSAASSGGESGGDGGLGALAGAIPGAAGGEGGGGEEQPPSDSSQDGWFEPSAHSDDDLTTYVWVEDENRKLNLLTLASPDQQFAEESKARFIRLLDVLREQSEDDLGPADGERLANVILEWLQARGRTEYIPRPKLKSDDEERSELTVPLQLEELLLLPGIGPDLYYDKVLDGKVIPGLESVLTIYTSLKFDPGDPNTVPAPAAAGSAAAPPAAPAPPPAAGGGKEPEQPVGLGVKINVNTAPRAVLRCLFPEHEISDNVIDALLLYRNEEAPEEGEASQGDDLLSDVELGTAKKKKIFAKLEDLEQVPEFANLANPEVKQRFLALVTVKADVFSVHMASMYKRNEERGVFVLRRTHSVLVRLEDSGDAPMHPLVLLEERNGIRVTQVDFPESTWDREVLLDEMDQFAQEERRWNPFHVEFYRPAEEQR